MIYSTLEPLVLGSQSPRRRAFLEQLGLRFSIYGPEIDERVDDGECPEKYVERMAVEKADAVALCHQHSFVLAADTAVCVDGLILGKPISSEDAVEMLMTLSGRSHEVWGGVCLSKPNSGGKQVITVSTRVRFSRFDERIASAYVAEGESLDKAGAYGIQGLGGFLVERIEGSYSNVVGLPLSETAQLLVSAGVAGLGAGFCSRDNS